MTDPSRRAPSIRNVILHLANEQPLLADLFEMPTAADAVLVCTNLRTMAGKRPVFVDDSAAVFYFPYAQLRFLEVPPSSLGERPADTGVEEPAAQATEPEAELELDEEFLRRIREV